MNELTDFQLLTLREMTAEHFRSTLDAPSDREFRSRYAAGMVALVRYVAAEGIAPALLREADEPGLGAARDAAALLTRPDDVAGRGGMGRQVLAAAGCLPPPLLSDAQQLELSLLCADVREAAAASQGTDQTRFIAALAAVVRFCREEHITPEMFSQVDQREFADASLAATLLQYPQDFTAPGCLGHRVLVAAGVPVPPHTEDDDSDVDPASGE